MARLARVVEPGISHHVTQRGNRRADVFLDDADRVAYRQTVETSFAQHGLRIWAYCLMSNHVHFVVVPPHESALAQSMRDAHAGYSSAFNRRHGVCGHLWQGRFFSCPLDGTHLWSAVRYVERNPVRAGMTSRAEAYPWSSAAAHCQLHTDLLLSAGFPFPGVVYRWREWLEIEDPADGKVLRECTATGRPCGSRAFVLDVERKLGRILTRQKPGPKSVSGSDEEVLLWN